MKTQPSVYASGVYTVHVDANELDCGFKLLPYPTCIGTVSVLTGKVTVWTPATSKPRGYREAAQAMLEDALASLRNNKT